MANSVDNRVVQMKFNNKQFQSATADSMSSLEKLKNALSFKGGSRGLDDLQKSANKFNMDEPGRAADGFSAKMVAMATVGITALANLTNRAVDAGLSMAKALTVEPLVQGFGEYELKMRSIQTILANTTKDGTTLDQVTEALNDLNRYADLTIYNFAEMTRNVGLFTNAGLKLEDATAALKGFSNEAAASGVGAVEAANAAYQLSQGLNSGIIRLIDWKSLTNAGFGSRFQDGLVELGEAMGAFEGKSVTAAEARDKFAQSLQAEWLTADVMLNFLKISTGDLTDEQVMALGLTKEQTAEFQKQAKIGLEAATKVRTVTQFWGTLQEAIGSGWAETFEILIGDFNSASTLFDRIGETINPWIERFSKARNDLLRGWSESGGRQMAIEGIANIFKTIAAILKPIGQAFRNLFPKVTVNQLTTLSEVFFMFTQKVREFVEGGADKLTGIFELVATVAKAVWTVIKFIAGVGFKVFGGIAAALFQLLGTIGELVQAFLDWAKPIEKIEAFSDKITSVLTPALKTILKYIDLLVKGFILLIREGPEPFLAMIGYIGEQIALDFDKIKDKLGSLGEGFSNVISKVQEFIGSLSFGDKLQGVQDFLGDLKDTITGVGDASEEMADSTAGHLETLRAGFGGGMAGAVGAVVDDGDVESPVERLRSRFEGVIAFFRDGFSKIGDGLSNMWTKFKEWLKNIDWTEVLAVVNTGFFGYITYQIGRLVKTLRETWEFGANAAEVMENFGDVLKGYSRDLNASALQKVGVAVALLAGSIIALGLMPTDKLYQGVAAVGAIMAAITAIFLIMSGKGNGKYKGAHRAGGSSKTSIAGGFNATQAAIRMNGFATALVIISGAILILSTAIAALGFLPTDKLTQGSLALAGILVAIGVLLKTMSLIVVPQGIVAGATAIFVIAAAIQVLVGAVATLGLIPEDKARAGLERLAALIAGVGLLLFAMQGLAVSGFGAAAAIGAIIGLLLTMVGIVVLLGNISDKGNLVQGLLALGGLIIAVSGLAAVLGTFAAASPGMVLGAQALIITAGALFIMAKAIEVLANLNAWDGLQAVLIMAAIIGLITAMGAIMLTPVGAGLLVLSGVMWTIGAAILAAGAGIFLLATGLALIGTVGAAGIYVLLGAAQTALTLIPIFFQQLALGIKGFLIIFNDAIPIMQETWTLLLGAVIQTIRENIPKIKDMLIELIQAGLEVIRKTVPDWLDTMGVVMDALRDFLVADNNVGKWTNTMVDMLVQMLNALSERANEIVFAFGNFFLSFLQAVDTWLENHKDDIALRGEKIAKHIVDGIGAGLKGAAKGSGGLIGPIWGLVGFIEDQVNAATDANSPAKRFIPVGKNITDGIAVGLGTRDSLNREVKSFTKDAKSGFSKAISTIASSVDTSMDMSPTITPVMDMSQFEKDAQKINSTLGDYAEISPSVSYQAANDLATQYTASKEAEVNEPTVVNFEYVQTNTSPDSLSTTEIYRQTKNQLSQVKRALQQI